MIVQLLRAPDFCGNPFQSPDTVPRTAFGEVSWDQVTNFRQSLLPWHRQEAWYPGPPTGPFLTSQMYTSARDSEGSSMILFRGKSPRTSRPSSGAFLIRVHTSCQLATPKTMNRTLAAMCACPLG